MNIHKPTYLTLSNPAMEGNALGEVLQGKPANNFGSLQNPILQKFSSIKTAG
ncbi:MAG: hypothetical protein LM517_05000 [Nitrosomonas sp.]|nr:hypothetical protein [Nitrosomonas sp.]